MQRITRLQVQKHRLRLARIGNSAAEREMEMDLIRLRQAVERRGRRPHRGQMGIVAARTAELVSSRKYAGLGASAIARSSECAAASIRPSFASITP